MTSKDFSNTLARWEIDANPSQEAATHPLNYWLDRYGVYDKDQAEEAAISEANSRQRSAARRRALWKRPIDATLDLHGCSANEAWDRLTNFMRDARNAGHRKVLIIHGKGLHTQTAAGVESVLRQTLRRFLESCPYAGESRQADTENGGSGATLILLKDKPDG